MPGHIHFAVRRLIVGLSFALAGGVFPAKIAAADSSVETASEAAAPGEETTSARSNDGPGESDRDFGHAGQFDLRIDLVAAYRMVFRYPDSPFCSEPDPSKGDDQQKLCGFTAPMAIDVALGFAPLDSVEPFVWGRFGLAGEGETNTQPLVVIGGGVRLYTMSDAAFKIFVEPSIGFELEKGAGNALWSNPGFVNEQPTYKRDLLLHLGAGPQIDLSPGVGLYGTGALTVGMFRSIQSWMELSAGVQARIP